MAPPHIAASLLGADLLALGEVVRTLEAAGVDALHLDVMDGRFVQPIAFGHAFAGALSRHTSLPVDVHLMAKDPMRHVARFCGEGIRRLVFHLEAEHRVGAMTAAITQAGAKAGLSLSPATGTEAVAWMGGGLEQVLVMTCEPGRGGQAFLAPMLRKVAALARLRSQEGFSYRIAVDGGVSEQTAGAAIAAGADDLVVGQALLAAPDLKAALGRLRCGEPSEPARR